MAERQQLVTKPTYQSVNNHRPYDHSNCPEHINLISGANEMLNSPTSKQLKRRSRATRKKQPFLKVSVAIVAVFVLSWLPYQGYLEVSEFLLLNSAKINVADSDIQTPLHLAVVKGHTGQVCQLLKRGAIQDLKNGEGKIPLDIAVDTEHADIVTLLRLAKLREDINETEPLNNPMEETVLGVFQDISQMASNQPELLKRRPSDITQNRS